MPRRSDEDDRDKPSWRDIDRKRDKSGHVDRSDPYAKHRGPKGRAPGPTTGYRSALDKVFEGGELPDKFKHLGSKAAPSGDPPGSKRQAALRRLRDAVGGTDVAAATTELLAIDGELPRDTDVLTSALQHPDETVQRDALRLLGEMYRERPFRRTDLLRQRVRKLEDLAEEPETAELAAELRRALG